MVTTASYAGHEEDRRQRNVFDKKTIILDGFENFSMVIYWDYQVDEGRYIRSYRELKKKKQKNKKKTEKLFSKVTFNCVKKTCL